MHVRINWCYSHALVSAHINNKQRAMAQLHIDITVCNEPFVKSKSRAHTQRGSTRNACKSRHTLLKLAIDEVAHLP